MCLLSSFRTIFEENFGVLTFTCFYLQVVVTFSATTSGTTRRSASQQQTCGHWRTVTSTWYEGRSCSKFCLSTRHSQTHSQGTSFWRTTWGKGLVSRLVTDWSSQQAFYAHWCKFASQGIIFAAFLKLFKKIASQDIILHALLWVSGMQYIFFLPEKLEHQGVNEKRQVSPNGMQKFQAHSHAGFFFAINRHYLGNVELRNFGTTSMQSKILYPMFSPYA